MAMPTAMPTAQANVRSVAGNEKPNPMHEVKCAAAAGLAAELVMEPNGREQQNHSEELWPRRASKDRRLLSRLSSSPCVTSLKERCRAEAPMC